MAYIDLDTKVCLATVGSGSGSGSGSSETCNDPLKIGCIFGIPDTYIAAAGVLVFIMAAKK